MTMSRPKRRQLDTIAQELLADPGIAAAVARFEDRPLSPRSYGGRRRRVGVGLIVATVLVLAAAPAFMVAAALTHVPAFLAGIVLVVPGFMLFGLCWQRRTGATERPRVAEPGHRVDQL
ncbi:MAG TPA: hypothetical protein VG317_08935 [Pseudonocardiaceae bacterium]|jgi:peptidoglycan/LPS O-acetylase OafA/YrhL|nr:hypothetical protein [Pseudonocardiaceae bacterium]